MTVGDIGTPSWKALPKRGGGVQDSNHISHEDVVLLGDTKAMPSGLEPFDNSKHEEPPGMRLTVPLPIRPNDSSGGAAAYYFAR